MQNITIDMVAQEAVDERTQQLRYSHPSCCSWFPTTQAWSWDGGDALVVITGRGRGVQCYVVLRFENELHVVAAGGVCQALRVFGFASAVN